MKLYFDFDHAGVARSVAKFQETRQRLQAAVETAQANLAAVKFSWRNHAHSMRHGVRGQTGPIVWDLHYDLPNESGKAGSAYKSEDGFWVAHTDRVQKSDCKTRKEAGEWLESILRQKRGV